MNDSILLTKFRNDKFADKILMASTDHVKYTDFELYYSCLLLLDDSVATDTFISLAGRFTLLGLVGDLHPLYNTHASQIKKKQHLDIETLLL